MIEKQGLKFIEHPFCRCQFLYIVLTTAGLIRFLVSRGRRSLHAFVNELASHLLERLHLIEALFACIISVKE